jgi:hypothetical protein
MARALEVIIIERYSLGRWTPVETEEHRISNRGTVFFEETLERDNIPEQETKSNRT